MVSHISTDHFEIEEMNDYETRKIQEDFLFLDDIKRFVQKSKEDNHYFYFIVIKKYLIHFHPLVLFGKIKNFD
jgi:hypothetical protein